MTGRDEPAAELRRRIDSGGSAWDARAMSIALDALVELLSKGRFAVLTGAGCSTESGIPDYRGPGTRARAKNPMSWRDFAGSASARARYWARATIGWERFSRAEPNEGHRALARLERAGAITGLVTQNVDRLHRTAGSRRVVELHGALAETRCTECGAREPRASVQARVVAANPRFLEHAAPANPDGDAELADDLVAGFVPPVCTVCGGVIRPDVVFFGENVAKPIVADAMSLVDEASALLVVGSSLAVYSGYRFVRRAVERAMPIAIVNIGPCRGEELASVRLHARAGETLAALADRLASDDRVTSEAQPHVA